MPHGTFDWGKHTPTITVFTLDDMAELAARLGSIDYYDRRGNVFFLDGFEHTLNKWYNCGLGVGNAAALDNTYAKDGEYSCKITAGQGNDNYGCIGHQGGGIVPSKIGFELAFTVNEAIKQYQFKWAISDGTHSHFAGIAYYPPTDLLKYYNEGGVYTTFATDLELKADPRSFHTIKFVADLTTDYYDYCLLDHVNYDLSALQNQNVEIALAPAHSMSIISTNSGDLNQSFYVDNTILTQNEP